VDYNRAAVVVSIQNWLGESEDSRKNASMPGYLNIGMSSKFATPFWPVLSFDLATVANSVGV
jgi:hypothetical protein